MGDPIQVHDHALKKLGGAEFELLHINHENPVKLYDGTAPHRHTFYELFLFHSKGDRHEIDFKKFPVNAYSAHFISPAQVHRLDHGKGRGTLFCFAETFLARADKKKISELYPYYSLNTHQPFMDLGRKDFNDVLFFAEAIEREYRSDSPVKFEVIAGLLMGMLGKLKEKYLSLIEVKKEFSVSTHPYVLEFLSLVERHYVHHLGVSDYAEKLSLSPNYLNALCKKELGTPAVKLIQERMLLEAKRLLYSTSLSIKEISAGLNFEDPAYFNRFFKKHTRQTPLLFRQTGNQ